MRSLARARSSSRRAPPNAALKPCSSIASSSVTDWSRLRDARGPVSSTTRPLSIDSCTVATIRSAPTSSTIRSRYSMTSGKFWPVSTCMTGNGSPAGQKALRARCSSTAESLPPGEEQHAALQLGGHLAHHVDRLRLERAEMRDLVAHVVRILGTGGYGGCLRAHRASHVEPALRLLLPGPAAVRGRCREACRERSRSTGIRGRAAGGRAGRARARSARRRPRSSPRAG